MRSRAKLFEPKLYVKISWSYLKEYDESMQKAKDYRLNYKCDNPNMIVKRPHDVSNDTNFLKDAELIRRDIETDLVNSINWGIAQIYDGESKSLERANSKSNIQDFGNDKFRC